MKHLLFAWAFLVAHAVVAQSATVVAPLLPADSVTHRIVFSGVVPVPLTAGTEIQARARQWVALTFEDAHQVIQLDDEARGVLIGRGYTELWLKTKPDGTGSSRQVLGFTFRLDFRDGRYRYEVTQLSLPVYPRSADFSYTPNGISLIASQQAYEQSAWQLGATATLEASPRRTLLQPERVYDKRNHDLAGRIGREWPSYSASHNQAVAQLLNSLRRYETAPPAHW